ncbi:15723_t:CDS:2, partial [Acaulospora morrowiae]
MTKHRHFTRLSSESESSFSQASAIPLQTIAPPDPATVNGNTSPDTQPILSNVPFIPVSPLGRRSIPGLDLDDDWPLNELPQELRGAEDYSSTSANNTEANSMRTDWKRELFLLLEDPSSSTPAFYVNVFVSFSIVLSAVLTTVETIPTFRSTSSSVWFNFETTIVIIFTIEYVLRLFAHSDSFKQLWRFVKTPLAIIDFIAIVPYYIELMFHHDTTYDFRFTILRLFRLLRVFKAFKYTSTIIMTIEVMIVAVKRSIDALGALFFFMVTSVVLFSTLLYFAERGTWDQKTQMFVD